ncbi:ABC transporter, permease [Moorella glycerini]|uniref:High-affinity branched-chain amino acid transport system permease protein LivH n=1 Tax=Neomoorella stamsii TaxID=1266720 RepID=A0A9X7J3R4_9FIRM|nr:MULTISPECIES: branched-chain amino acid ABC transporter permease [Moorella]PRR73454.1 High-affinity branched-chain amino acid transport system permease protein LivH [Moorella stamsii]CEP69223.1 ABC transporter, permease [Moorella glycerini]
MNNSAVARQRFPVSVVFLLMTVIVLVVLPFFIRGYWIRVMTTLFMSGAMAEALNLIVGYAGYAAFGNGVFFGIGAYTTAVLMTRLGWSFFPAMLASCLLAATIAFLLGWPVLRLRGHYFAIATIGINMAVMEIVTYIGITGGGKGISLPLYPGDIVKQGLFFYYTMFILLIVSVAITYWIANSRLGYGLRAIKTEPEAAEVMGVNTTLYKVMAWSISAAITGIAGSLNAYWLTFLEPLFVFDIMISVETFVMVLLGGAGTIFGPVIGAFFLKLLSELVWSQFTLIHMGVLGLIIVIITLFLPSGIMGLWRQMTLRRNKALNMVRTSPGSR